jgi:hypothetical protein
MCGQNELKGLHTSDDIAYVRKQLDAGLSPWKEAFARLESSSYASPSYTASPVEWLARLDATNWSQLNSRWENAGIADLWYSGIHVNYTNLMRDAAAAYQLGLRYVLTDDERYATAAKNILVAWASTNKGFLRNSSGELIDPNEYLMLIQGHQLAAAAQLLRNSNGWSSTDDFAHVCSWLKSVFYPVAATFLQGHDISESHYWLNWDLASMTAVLGIGILCDDVDMEYEAINYFKSGNGIGNIHNAVPYLYDDPSGSGETLGQCNESGRDQGHATLCATLMGTFCQMAEGIGEDLFAYDNYRAVAMAEYIAKYNVGNDSGFLYDTSTIPYTSYYYCGQQMDAISESGRGTSRPSWDIWTGYCTKNGISCKYSNEIASLDRPDAGGGSYGPNSGGFDQLGFSTLMFYRTDAPVVNATTGVGYTDFTSAWNSAVDGDSLLVNSDQTVSTRLGNNQRSITVRGNAEGVRLVRTNPSAMMFLVNGGSQYSVKFENIILDGNNSASTLNFVESNGNAVLTLDNVVIKDARTTNGKGLVVAKGGGKLAIRNVSADNCVVPENMGEICICSPGSSISGSNALSIALEKTTTFSVAGELTNDEPIALYCYGDEFQLGNTVVLGCTDADKFVLGNTDFCLMAENGNLVVGEDNVTGIVSAVVDDSSTAPIYYDLFGRRVNQPATGLFVRRCGAIAEKVFLK